MFVARASLRKAVQIGERVIGHFARDEHQSTGGVGNGKPGANTTTNVVGRGSAAAMQVGVGLVVKQRNSPASLEGPKQLVNLVALAGFEIGSV